MKHTDIMQDVYAIPINDMVERSLQGEYHLLYAPKAGISCVVDAPYLQKLQAGAPECDSVTAQLRSTRAWDAAMASGDTPATAGILYILPNYKCNLSCTYCYAAKGRSSAEIDKQSALDAMDSFFSTQDFPQRRQGRPLRITFMGGGEPLLSWDVVHACIRLASQRAQECGCRVRFSIITNGTILTDDILSCLKEHEVRVNVSFDITPELQALQRGQHERVSRNINLLLQNGVGVLIRSTITPQSAPKLVEMAEYAAAHFPQLRKLAFEPVTDPSLSPEELGGFLACFRSGFFAAREWLQARGISLVTSDYLSARQPASRHCAGSVSLNPQLSLTACPCFSSPKETGYEANIMGRLQEGRLQVDEGRYADIMPSADSLPASCHSCFARWNCAGGCIHQRNVYTPRQMREICRHTRLMLRKILFDKADEQVRAAGGSSLLESLE